MLSGVFDVLRFMERGTETLHIGAGVVAWRARDVLGKAMCYVR